MPVENSRKTVWYRACQCKGEVERIMDDVELRIARCGLRKFVPEVIAGTFYGRDGRNKNRQEFYLYIGITSERKGYVPPEVQTKLLHLNQYLSGGGTDCSVDEVEDVKEEWRKRVAGRVFYRVSKLEEAPVFHDQHSGRDGASRGREASNSEVEEVTRYDRLLQFLSTTGEGSWAQFCRICASLWNIAQPERPEHILRRLRLLGHLVINADRTRWRVAPPTLLALSPFEEDTEDDCARYVLCGARDEYLLNALGKVGHITRHVQPGDAGPATIYLSAAPAQLEQALLNRPELQDVLLQSDFLSSIAALPTLNEWQAGLSAYNDLPTHSYDMRCYNGETFQSVHFNGDIGMYELWERSLGFNDNPQRVRTLFYSDDGVWRGGDWYGLRFLHQASFEKCPYVWYAATRRLMLPKQWRLPHLYEHALVLASGQLPVMDEDEHWFVYPNITQDLMDLLASKLPLQPQRG